MVMIRLELVFYMAQMSMIRAILFIKRVWQYLILSRYGGAIGKISHLYADLCIKVLKDIQSNKSLIAKKQNHAEATYSLWRDRQDYHINWQWDSARIVRFIDAVGFPYDGAKTMFENKILKVLKAEVIKDVVVANRDCGKVIFMENKCCIVVCGIGLVKLCEVVDENGQRWIAPNFRIHFR